jgi:hypothetical protein
VRFAPLPIVCAYIQGRAEIKPTLPMNWHKGEMGFFYIIPPRKEAQGMWCVCVSSDKHHLNHAMKNRQEWEIAGPGSCGNHDGKC